MRLFSSVGVRRHFLKIESSLDDISVIHCCSVLHIMLYVFAVTVEVENWPC